MIRFRRPTLKKQTNISSNCSRGETLSKNERTDPGTAQSKREQNPKGRMEILKKSMTATSADRVESLTWLNKNGINLNGQGVLNTRLKK